MNDILKQRLVGALILVALGVIFWPIIFVQPEDKLTEDVQAIPAPPNISTMPIEAPEQGNLRGSPELNDNPDAEEFVVTDIVESTDSTPPPVEAPPQPPAEVETAKVRSEAPEKLKMDSDGLPMAWTLQIATVSSAEKADGLRKKLLDMNLKAYVVTVSSGGKKLYRVCVGPKFERAEMDQLKTTIDAKFKVTSMVARYIP